MPLPQDEICQQKTAEASLCPTWDEIMIVLEKITKDNIDLYSAFETADVGKYQSRIYPNEKCDKKLWYYIKYDSLYIGSIWLEKFNRDDFAVLGIFIAYSDYRNRGIGSNVIKMMLDKINILGVNKITLRVRENNERAIKCYEKVGFIESKKYIKENGIKAIEMMYEL